MTEPNKPIIQTRRQQFLTENYYEELLPLLKQNLEWLKQEDWSKSDGNDQYNCEEAERWRLMSRQNWLILQLEYTAGKPIEEMSAYLEQVIAARENQARAEAEYFKTSLKWVIGGSEESYLLPLQLIGLAYLLQRKDFIPRIQALIEGRGEMYRDIGDTTYLALLRFNNPSLEMKNKAWNSDYVDLDNALYEENTTKDALNALTDYLKEWYLLHEDHLWHDSHLDLVNNDKYVGYWSFESAAVVYLLGLDDSSLHQFLYYPKDLVAYARARAGKHAPTPKTIAAPSNYTGNKLVVGDTCAHTSWYQAPYLNNRIMQIQQGQTITGEAYTQRGQVIWYELTHKYVQELKEAGQL